MIKPPAQRVEVVVSGRTLLVLLGVGLLVALAIVSLGTLLSIFLAAVLALGLDPIVGALVRRGWKRGRASLLVFALLFASVFALVVLAAGPVWDQVVEFVGNLPEYWDQLTKTDGFQQLMSTADADQKIASALPQAGDARRYHRVSHALDRPPQGDVVVSRRRQGEWHGRGGSRCRRDADGLMPHWLHFGQGNQRHQTELWIACAEALFVLCGTNRAYDSRPARPPNNSLPELLLTLEIDVLIWSAMRAGAATRRNHTSLDSAGMPR